MGISDKPKSGKDIRSFLTDSGKAKTPASSTVTSGSNKPGSNIFGFNNINGASSTSNKVPKPITGSPVNRVVGFGNLSSANSTVSKPSTVTSKGNVLGKGSSGANKPRKSTGPNTGIGRGNNNGGTTDLWNTPRGRGMGGMLANKGGGTLVVTAPQKKTKTPEKPESPDTKLRVDKFKLFAGSGQTLGGGNIDRSKSRLLSLGESQAKKAKPDGHLGKEPKYEKDEEMCKCSVCSRNIPREEMGLHLENCSGLQNVFNNSIVDAEDEAENIDGENKVPCPICNIAVEGDINAHVDECLNSSGIFNMIDDEPETQTSDDLVFVREYKVPKPMKAAVSDVQIVEQEEEARVACPLCGMRFGASRINEHVNQCLDSD